MAAAFSCLCLGACASGITASHRSPLAGPARELPAMPVSGAASPVADTPPNSRPVVLPTKELPTLGSGAACGDTPGERARAQCLASNAVF